MSSERSGVLDDRGTKIKNRILGDFERMHDVILMKQINKSRVIWRVYSMSTQAKVS